MDDYTAVGLATEFNALIQWNDTGEFADVIITTNDITDDDDYIFFYFKDVNEIEEFKKIGVEEFRIVSYLPITRQV